MLQGCRRVWQRLLAHRLQEMHPWPWVGLAALSGWGRHSDASGDVARAPARILVGKAGWR